MSGAPQLGAAPGFELPAGFVTEATPTGIVLRHDPSHGQVRGQHYTDCVGAVKQLKREGRLDEARALLAEAVDACEREAAAMTAVGRRWKLAPWYYEHLAIVARKMKRHEEECAVLERYLAHPNTIPECRGEFEARLAKARALAARAAGAAP